MSDTVDARGLSCPQPVMLVLEKIKQTDQGEMIVLVDTDTAKENVTRAASSKGWDLSSAEEEGECCRLILQKG